MVHLSVVSLSFGCAQLLAPDAATCGVRNDCPCVQLTLLCFCRGGKLYDQGGLYDCIAVALPPRYFAVLAARIVCYSLQWQFASAYLHLDARML